MNYQINRISRHHRLVQKLYGATRKTIAVFNPDTFERILFRALITKRGYYVINASSRSELLRIVTTRHVDLIVVSKKDQQDSLKYLYQDLCLFAPESKIHFVSSLCDMLGSLSNARELWV